MKKFKEDLFTAILVFVLGWMCGMIFVMRMSDPKNFKEKYGHESYGKH